MREYLILISHTATGYSAHCPDVDGCIATGASIAEVTSRMQEALQAHIEGMIEDGDPVPAPNTISAFVSVAAPASEAPTSAA